MALNFATRRNKNNLQFKCNNLVLASSIRTHFTKPEGNNTNCEKKMCNTNAKQNFADKNEPNWQEASSGVLAK